MYVKTLNLCQGKELFFRGSYPIEGMLSVAIESRKHEASRPRPPFPRPASLSSSTCEPHHATSGESRAKKGRIPELSKNENKIKQKRVNNQKKTE